MKSIIQLLLLSLAFLACAERISYRNYKLYKIIPKDKDALKFLKDLRSEVTDFSPYDFWTEPVRVDHPVNLMVSPEFQSTVEEMLDGKDVEKEIVIEDVQDIFDEEMWSVSDDPNPVNWSLYNTLDEINGWLEEQEEAYSDYVTVLKPGKSHQGRDIVGVKVDLTPNITKQSVFIESNMLARDWITSSVTTYILNEFLNGENETVIELARSYVWYFFPVMNPDGFVYSHDENRLWKKTRTRYNIFCWGADPNLNWNIHWMLRGASQNPCSDNYAGPNAESEASVRVMKEFITSIADNMIAYLGFQAYGQMLLIPYGHTSEHFDNYDELKEIGEKAVAKLKQAYRTVYTVGNIPETSKSEVSGNSMDWVKATFQTPIVYTWKLRDTGSYGFTLPYFLIIPTANETLDSLISIFEEYKILHS